MTPLQVAHGWTIPQLAVLLLDAGKDEGAAADPFKPGPGEHVRGRG